MVQIRDLTVQDLERVAVVHVLAFPDSALTKLGVEATRRYYAWQLTGPHECRAFGAFLDGELGGFCFGGIFRGALSGFLRTNRWFLIGRILTRPHLLLHSVVRARLFQTRRILPRLVRPGRAGNQSGKRIPKQTSRSFGILSIAVDPRCQGAGVGRALMEAAEAASREGAFSRMHLTVSPENIQAIRFYERLGWTRVAEENWQGRMMKSLEV